MIILPACASIELKQKAQEVVGNNLIFNADDDYITLELRSSQAKKLRKLGLTVEKAVELDAFILENKQKSTSPPKRPKHPKTMADIMRHNRAQEVWKWTRGRGVYIAVIDTGVSRAVKEIPSWKRSNINISNYFSGKHWSDPSGHGSMVAAIAAGTKTGGLYNGVAPEAKIISVRSNFYNTDLYRSFRELLRKKDIGEIDGPLVINCCHGLKSYQAPDLYSAYLEVVKEAAHKGVPVVCAAGNHHRQYAIPESQCKPNTIWNVNSLDEALCVGAVDMNNSNADSPHNGSCRGPGQLNLKTKKPDCVAPSYGHTIWGDGYRRSEWWGTGGAAAQVSGLIALILSIKPDLTPFRIYEIIRNTCYPLGKRTCYGAGVIDCYEAVQAVREIV